MSDKRHRPGGTPTPRLIGDLSLPTPLRAADAAKWFFRVGGRVLTLTLLTILALIVIFLLGLAIHSITGQLTPGF